jgi:CDP-diacylglycerol--serine O-phosphatidyltransferase
MRPAANHPKHFSMIREFHLADFFTLGNAACGMAAVFCAMAYVGSPSLGHFFGAAALVLAGLVFDVLDGRVARWRHNHSALGRELDSLADIISFGVAPAALGFAAGLRGGWDWVALIYFVCCGVSRLARFNVTAESLSEGKDKRPAGRHAGLGRVAGPAGRESLLGRVGRLALGVASAGFAVRPVRNPDDQQNVTHPQILKTPTVAPPFRHCLFFSLLIPVFSLINEMYPLGALIPRLPSQEPTL